MPSKLDPELPSADFIKALRAFMRENDVTSKQLSEELNLTIGTVRNWFYGNKDMPRKHKDKIAEIMDKVFGEEHDPLEMDFLALGHVSDAKTTLWTFAANIPEYDFTKAFTFAKYTKSCALWCTKTIMAETKRILAKLPPEEAQNIASQLVREDQKTGAEKENRFKPQYRSLRILRARNSVAARATVGATVGKPKIFIPVFVKEYKHFFVRIAAKAARKKDPEQELSYVEFIVSCLNEGASKAFNGELERIRSQKE